MCPPGSHKVSAMCAQVRSVARLCAQSDLGGRRGRKLLEHTEKCRGEIDTYCICSVFTVVGKV